jgi:endo-1,4-beta-D-glucanase Y
MRSRTLVAIAAATLGVVATASIAVAVSTPSPVIDSLAVDAPHRFLEQYVEPDGRVVRRDQGNDTVTEGQAYGMLLAVAVGSEDTFRSIWAWTTKHLLRPDGLLSWRWADGAVTDANSAADADLDAARALVLGGERFADAALTAAGVRLGQAILDGETVSTPVGRILTAGS